MKLLSILRHAKSSWKDSSLEDHDRPLNKRGTRDAPRMGDLIREQGLVPDVILSSTARRARDTALAVATAAGFPEEVRLTRSLYGASPDTCLDVLRDLPDSIGHAMIVGHNPLLEDLVSMLTDEYVALPTATVACIDLPLVSWQQVGADGCGRVRFVFRGKDVGEDD